MDIPCIISYIVIQKFLELLFYQNTKQVKLQRLITIFLFLSGIGDSLVLYIVVYIFVNLNIISSVVYSISNPIYLIYISIIKTSLMNCRQDSCFDTKFG